MYLAQLKAERWVVAKAGMMAHYLVAKSVVRWAGDLDTSMVASMVDMMDGSSVESSERR